MLCCTLPESYYCAPATTTSMELSAASTSLIYLKATNRGGGAASAISMGPLQRTASSAPAQFAKVGLALVTFPTGSLCHI